MVGEGYLIDMGLIVSRPRAFLGTPEKRLACELIRRARVSPAQTGIKVYLSKTSVNK